jgi:hypothetical protein
MTHTTRGIAVPSRLFDIEVVDAASHPNDTA